MSNAPRRKELGMELVYSVLAAGLFIGAFYGGLQFSGYVGQGAFIVIIAAYALFGFAYLAFALSPDMLEDDLQQDFSRGEAGDIQLFLIPVVFVISFVFVFYGANKIYPGVYFSQQDVTLLDWFLFAFDAILQVLLLDFLDVFEIDISTIGNPESLTAKIVVYSYKVVLSVGLVSVFLQTFRAIRRAGDGGPQAR